MVHLPGGGCVGLVLSSSSPGHLERFRSSLLFCGFTIFGETRGQTSGEIAITTSSFEHELPATGHPDFRRHDHFPAFDARPALPVGADLPKLASRPRNRAYSVSNGAEAERRQSRSDVR